MGGTGSQASLVPSESTEPATLWMMSKGLLSE